MATSNSDSIEKKPEDNSAMEQCYENLIVVDVGANLTNKKYSRDLDSVIQRAKDAGVQKIMVTGTSVKNSKEALRLTRIYPGILYSTAGIHPHDAKSYTDESWQELKLVAHNSECVAIGECGLDYNRNFSEPDEQKHVFQKQIELACELPETYLSKGFYLGLTGYLCKDKSDSGVRKLLVDGTLPLDRLLVETDAPFMYPNTRASKLPPHVKDALTERSMTFLHRYCTFQRNEPCSLPAIVELIAAFMNKKPEEVALATAFNALKLFGLS
ncbi:uncharacterized protein CBL_08352 [Carabus blaptoides fortunei]